MLCTPMILKLTGNKVWHLSCGDPDADCVALAMAQAMGIDAPRSLALNPASNNRRRLILFGRNPKQLGSIGTHNNLPPDDLDFSSFDKSPSTSWVEHNSHASFWVRGLDTACMLSYSDSADVRAQQLLLLSLIIGRQAEEDGGLLMHGGLTKWHNEGIVLAGPSGVGKSTACMRLPAEWMCLCDDTSLLIPDDKGCFWAHPWPTWSRFMAGGPGGRWDVQSAVPLRAIFILSKGKANQAEKLGTGHAVPLLVEIAEQGASPIFNAMEPNQARACRLKRFDTICKLAKKIPCYHLKISRTGEFWREIERALGQSHDAGNP